MSFDTEITEIEQWLESSAKLEWATLPLSGVQSQKFTLSHHRHVAAYAIYRITKAINELSATRPMGDLTELKKSIESVIDGLSLALPRKS